MTQEFDEVAAFFAEIPVEKRQRPVKAKPAPEEGSLAEAEEQGRKATAREERRAKRLAKLPVVQNVGTAPEADPRPKCRLCPRRTRLSPNLTKLPSGEEVRLCPDCVKQVEFDREKRCVSCGSPTAEWCPGHTCGDCHSKGIERARNLRNLLNLKWLANPGDVRA